MQGWYDRKIHITGCTILLIHNLRALLFRLLIILLANGDIDKRPS